MSNQESPWFSGGEGAVLMYKVNRRLRSMDLFTRELPDDVLAHFQQTLLFGEPIITGRKFKRTWYLGNRRVDNQDRMLYGQIGWEKHDSAQIDAYDEDSQEWIDTVEETGVSARSAFAFSASSMLLGVARHSSFRDSTLAKVFTELLNEGEDRLETSTTDWDVEPILDEAGFTEWLQQTQAVERVKFVAKLPNPGGLDEFKELWERLDRMKAGKIEESIEAQDPEVGLEAITSEPESAQYIAMSSRGYGYITASGSSQSRKRKYDQRNKVRRVYIEYPESWRGLENAIGDAIREYCESRT